MKFCYNSNFTLPKQSHRSRSILQGRSRSLGLFWKETRNVTVCNKCPRRFLIMTLIPGCDLQHSQGTLTLGVGTGNTLEGDVSDVIALDQLMSPFLFGKRQECRPNFPQNTVFQYTFQYTCVISWCLTSGEVQHAFGQVYIKNRYVVEDQSGKAADVFPQKNRGIR